MTPDAAGPVQAVLAEVLFNTGDLISHVVRHEDNPYPSLVVHDQREVADRAAAALAPLIASQVAAARAEVLDEVERRVEAEQRKRQWQTTHVGDAVAIVRDLRTEGSQR